MNTLTIYALATDSTLTEDVYTSPRAKQLWIKLEDHLGGTLVNQTVHTVGEALNALSLHSVDDCTVAYNTDCTQRIYAMANTINQHFLPS